MKEVEKLLVAEAKLALDVRPAKYRWNGGGRVYHYGENSHGVAKSSGILLMPEA